MDSFKFSYAKKKKSKRDLNHCITGKSSKIKTFTSKLCFLVIKLLVKYYTKLSLRSQPIRAKCYFSAKSEVCRLPHTYGHNCDRSKLSRSKTQIKHNFVS